MYKSPSWVALGMAADFPAFSHRASTAFRAISFRSSGVKDFALAFPPSEAISDTGRSPFASSLIFLSLPGKQFDRYEYTCRQEVCNTCLQESPRNFLFGFPVALVARVGRGEGGATIKPP